MSLIGRAALLLAFAAALALTVLWLLLVLRLPPAPSRSATRWSRVSGRRRYEAACEAGSEVT